MRLQRGFSLTELVIAAGIGTLVVFIIGGVANMAVNNYLRMTEKMEAQEVAVRAEVLLKTVFSQALEIHHTPGTIPANLGNNPGRILNGIDFNRIADTPAAWTALAVFLRESAQSAPGMQNGIPRKTAIWYRRPEAAQNTSGVIFVDMGPAPGAVPGPTMSPDYADQYIDRVSRLRMVKNRHPLYDRVVSLDVELAIRYHTSRNTPRTWCPAADIGVLAACNPNSHWADYEHRFTILLKNNLLRRTTDFGLAGGFEERVLGPVFSFHPVLPVIR